MREQKSAGGIVLYEDKVLVLQKFNGNYVLPKGRINDNESVESAAIREVFEETGIKAEIIKYVGEIHYTYKDLDSDETDIHKIVHWYLMETKQKTFLPQREEGFVEAKYLPFEKAISLLKHTDEKNILQAGLKNIPRRE